MITTKLELALTALIGHCEQELINKGQLSRDQELKLQRLIWQIKQMLK